MVEAAAAEDADVTRLIFAGAATLLLLAGCGSDEEADNAADPGLNAAGGMPLGNDASAMEIVGNQGSAVSSLPPPAAGNDAGPADNRSGPAPRDRDDESNRSRSAPPPAEDVDDSPPGGDRGGNSVERNFSGI